ncbi:hypothetical protein JAAARDRAFT_581258 [Jaapia argillacea MUCL 33604]|uniref:Uncharacterized protein n=1 Tax=Jaapia argillacea MUCL 33604 TaxID=933084 RepID=A0A067P6U0_9AGAM|nr:hypothetical protein JAAARDRAFT_581258 [Jaapia argillacea MUCL 33604]
MGSQASVSTGPPRSAVDAPLFRPSFTPDTPMTQPHTPSRRHASPDFSPSNLDRWHPKVTGYRILVLSLTIGFVKP